MAPATKTKRPREVTGVISAPDVLRATVIQTRPVEVRQKQDGTWSLLYPDPGFNPCDCSERCKSETLAGPTMIEAHTIFATLSEALEEAKHFGGVGEPKVVSNETQSERMKRIWAEKRAEKEAAAAKAASLATGRRKPERGKRK